MEFSFDSLRSDTMEDRKTSDSESKTTEVTSTSTDFYLLTEEKFDFDLSLSPTSENEDEVFVGPVGHKEKCIAVCLESHEESQKKIQSLTYDPTWSPPAGDKFVEIFKEAHLLAFQLKSGNKAEKNNTIHLRGEKTEGVEKFVKESKSKLKILEKEIVTDKTPTTTRRETYCIWESPSSQLLPSLQKRLGQPVATRDHPYSPRVSLNTPSPAKTNKLSKMHTVSSAHAKNDTNLKKRSKFQTVTTSPALRNNSYLAAGETKQGQLPSSSNSIYSNSMGSSEDLLSDKSSMASDAGELSFSTSSSMQSKRTFPTPTKLEMKTRQLKPPNNVHMRRNTSSSSSSSISSMNSSLNSSLSISPKRGNVKTSVTKAPADISRRSSVTSKISIVKPMKVFSVNAAHSDASGKQLTPCAKGNPVNIPKYKASLTSESASSNLQKGADSNLQKLLSKNTLGNASTSSSLKLNSKIATPNLKRENEATRVLQSNPVLSGSNIESNIAVSTPVKQLERTVLKSCSAVKPSLRTPDRRHSTLPMSVGRYTSGIPTPTPKTLPRKMTSPNCLALRHISSVSSKKTIGISSRGVTKNKTWMSSSPSSTEGDLSPPQVIPIALAFSPDKPFIEIEEDITKKGKTTEVMLAKKDLLIEFETVKTPVAMQEYENKPLIDLFNTPEITKAPPLKPTGQLIDLNSPLMKLSPEGNKENSPLLKF
ncbi:G2 and S phase-expressed protein 1 isoform X1 [Crotalus tigris]|uniref:G2 and S phase-expressed protein 1 isoform X1 n=2 Tax=Crotalus tigris TaxID=88082 RepID=UPI00192F99E0|nr:G2 and S phase-expressed protein 1 isoform X1 [Crotalus tigris]